MGKIANWLPTAKELRARGKRIENQILAYGEVTNHTHRLLDETAFERYELDGKTYLIVSEVGVRIDHEEHGLGVIERGPADGVHEVRIDREYDYMADMARNSID